MKSLAIWAGVLGITTSVWAGPAINQLVDDRAFGYIDVPSLSGLREKGANSPFAKMWADEKIRKFIAPTLEKIEFNDWDQKVESRTGQPLKDWFEMVQGELLLAFLQKSDGEPGVVFVADVGEHAAKIEALIVKAVAKSAEAKDTTRFGEEEVAGIRVHSFTTTLESGEGDAKTTREETDYWFSHDGVFGYSPEKDEIANLAAAVTRGGAINALGKSDAFQREMVRLNGQGIRFLVDFNRLNPVLAAKARESQAGKQVPPMMAADAILTTIGIAELDTLSLALRFDDQSLDTLGALNWRNERGLVKLLAFKPGPLAQPDFVPQRWLTVSTMKFSLGDAFAAVKDMINSHHPATAAMFAANLAGMNAKVGFDIERDLFGSLGEDVLIASAPRPGIPLESLTAFDVDQFYALSLANPKAFATVLETILNQIDPQNKGTVARRDYLGVSISSIGIAPDPLGRPRTVSLCVWRNQLFISIGSPSSIEAAIKTGTEREPNLWQLPEVKAAYEKIPANSVAFSFQDNRSSTAMVIETFARAAEMAQGADGKPLLDRSAQPTADDLAKYWSNSYGYMLKDGQSITVHSTLPYLK